MKTKTLLSLLAIAGTIFFTSCKKDDPSPLSKEEATAKLNSIDGEYSTILTELSATQGNQVNSTMDDLYMPFDAFPMKSIRPESVTKDPASTIPNLNLVKSKLFSDFVFTEYTGTWEYSKTSYRFIRTSSTPSNQIILKFPHPYSNSTNNASITYYDYLSTTILGSTVTTQLKADVKIGDQIVYSRVFTATYSSLTNTKYKLVNTFGQFIETTELDLNYSTTQISLNTSSSLTKNGNVVYKTTDNGVFKFNSTTQSWDVTVNANIVILSIEVRINLAFNTKDLTSSTYDPNNVLKVSIYTTSGAKIGDIKQVKVNGDWVPYIYFANGDNAPITNYGQNFSEITSFIKDLFNIPDEK